MEWNDEHYVKLFTRNTLTWKSWTWEARTVFLMLLRRVNMAGFLETGDLDPVEAIALQIDVPAHIVEIGLKQLLKSKTCELLDQAVLISKFVDAQETPKSPQQAKRDHRERVKTRRRTAGKTNQSEIKLADQLLNKLVPTVQVAEIVERVEWNGMERNGLESSDPDPDLDLDLDPDPIILNAAHSVVPKPPKKAPRREKTYREPSDQEATVMLMEQYRVKACEEAGIDPGPKFEFHPARANSMVNDAVRILGLSPFETVYQGNPISVDAATQVATAYTDEFLGKDFAKDAGWPLGIFFSKNVLHNIAHRLEKEKNEESF